MVKPEKSGKRPSTLQRHITLRPSNLLLRIHPATTPILLHVQSDHGGARLHVQHGW